uniref:Uncharacterized protein n=1 Tax=viral metagenome TaxID=1070528 RepID=A0A6C0KKB1_9ZZZZ
MELAKLILKLIYLIILFVLCFAAIRTNVQTSNANLMVLSFFIAVFILYFTFNPLYGFLADNEIVFKSTEQEEPEHKNNNGNHHQ